MFYCSNNTGISNNTVILCNNTIDYFTNIICDKDNKCYCLCIEQPTENNNIFSNVNSKQYGISLLLFILLLICCSCYVSKCNKFRNINYIQHNNNISDNTLTDNTLTDNTLTNNTLTNNTLTNNTLTDNTLTDNTLTNNTELPNYNDINYSIIPIYTTTTTNNNYTYISPPVYSQIYNI